MAQPYDPLNPSLSDMAEQARQQAAQNLARRQRQPTPRDVPQAYQSWGNLAQDWASQYPPQVSDIHQLADPNYAQQVVGMVPLQAGTLMRAKPGPMRNLANQMTKQGAPTQDIWENAKIWASPWGSLEEIADYHAKLDPEWRNMPNQRVPLNQILEHPEFFNRFPSANKWQFRYDPTRSGYGDFARANRWTIPFLPNEPATVGFYRGAAEPHINPRETMFHEMQHGVAEESKPRLPLGSSPEAQGDFIAARRGPAWQHYQQLLQRGYPPSELETLEKAAKLRGYFEDPGELLGRLNEFRSRLSPDILSIENPGQSLENMLHQEPSMNRHERYLMETYGINPLPNRSP
jgi:hypothetical protein